MNRNKYPAEISLFSLGKIIFAADFKNALKMVSQGIYSIVLLVFSNVFMTFAWYGHLKMREEFSWFAALPLIGVIAFSWAIAFLNIVCRFLPIVWDLKTVAVRLISCS